ncbi:fluoride efflux transporter CrcB [Balneolales bacterium ANBcel1]|nr:fluoride efflux transporter CrcB [Balneolales bacterium ANBcel1]
MRELLLVALGGAFGSVLRYLFSIGLPMVFDRSLLVTATMVVNILGCVIIGFLIQWMEARQLMDTGLRLLVIAGFLGGFTTFSAFGLEAVMLFKESVHNALWYIGLQLTLCIGGVWIGLAGCRWLLK